MGLASKDSRLTVRYIVTRFALLAVTIFATSICYASSSFDVHAQATSTAQAHPAFHAAYSGTNSLNADADAAVTNDVTLFLGLSPWHGGEFWYNPEFDQGFGLSDTLGVAGFTSGEAYKVGKKAPYFRSQRLFFRQTINLGGKSEDVSSDANQHAQKRNADHLVVTLGKFGVGDIFDTNVYAHDPRQDFFNWTLIDTGSFDYAADSWGYAAGGAAEIYKGAWTLRGGVMALSNIPNGETLDLSFAQHQWLGEVERRYTIGKNKGAIRITAFDSYGRMGRFDDALSRGVATNMPPSTALVRRYAHRAGVSGNVEQALSDNLGVFLRAGVADGSKETFEFTDVDRTFAAGLSLKGVSWRHADDSVGAAFVINDISKARQAFLAAGGLGVLIGDGALRHKGDEIILESYYSYAFAKWAHLSLDGQLVINPGYNVDRGPAAVLGVRLHLNK